jgi:hypothetical protein
LHLVARPWLANAVFPLLLCTLHATKAQETARGDWVRIACEMETPGTDTMFVFSQLKEFNREEQRSYSKVNNRRNLTSVE